MPAAIVVFVYIESAEKPMSVIVEWVRRSGVSSSKEVDFRSSCEEIPKEALIPNMRMIRATATKTRVLMWNNTFPTIFRSGLILPPLPSAYLYLMPMLFSCELLSFGVPLLDVYVNKGTEVDVYVNKGPPCFYGW